MRFLPLLVVATLTSHVRAVLVEVNTVSCSNMTVSINATLQEFEMLPQYLRVAIENQTQIATLPPLEQMPTTGVEARLTATASFEQPFILPDGTYDLVIDMITSANTNNSVASMQMRNVAFQGCYAGSTSSQPTSQTGAVASAVISPSALVYHTALGVPSHGVHVGNADSSSDGGLSSGTKIGITVGILALALLSVLAAMAFLYRRWKQKQGDSSSGSKAARYVNGRWINDEDRNSAELKEVHPIQA